MTDYPPDPGKAFDSDVHRRVQANVPNPDDDPLSIEDLMALRIAKDDHLNVVTAEVIEDIRIRSTALPSLYYITRAELEDVLMDLEADGHSEWLKDGWRNTPDGFKALTSAPAGEED